MRNPAFLLSLALLLPASGSAQAKAVAGGKGVRWVSLEEGVSRASSSGKHVFVSVYTDWCGYCRKLNNVTLRAEPVLAELEKSFESVLLNAESAQPVTWKGKKSTTRDLTGRTWGITGYPTLVFISPKGEVIGSFASYAEPDLMLQILTYISSGARARKVSFDDYLGGKG